MKQYLSKSDARKFVTWLEKQDDSQFPKYRNKYFKPENKGNWAKGEKFYKPSGQLAFGFETNGSRTETFIFIDDQDHINKVPHGENQ